MGNHKRRLLTCAKEDRTSNLPLDLIVSILERLPVQDAVRTSILSKNWRYRWTTMTVLVFDEQFFKKVAKIGVFGRNGYIRIINHVLILHNGPISKFSLYIPDRYHDSFQEVDQTMILISRKSVRELVLTNSKKLESFLLGDLDQLHGALCLVRNSPNVERLWMRSKIVMHYDVGPASNHLESPDCLDQTLNLLQTVEIKYFERSRPALLFIKVLLAHSPSLEKLTIQPSGTCDIHELLNIVKDIMQFPRASTKAGVLLLDPKP